TEKFGRMVSHVTQSLHDDGFVFNTGGKSQLIHYRFHITNLPDTIKDAQTRCFPAAAYAALTYRFTGYTSQRVDVAGSHTHISIQYPGHFTLPGTVIGSRHVGAGPYKI